MQIVQTLKKNRKWLIYGGIGIGVVVLFMLLSRGGGGGQVVQGGGSNPQQDALNAELALRSMEMQGQLSLAGMQIQAQENAAEREFDMLVATLNSQAGIADMQTAAQLEAMALQSAENRYLADRQFTATMAQISSAENIATSQLEAGLARDALQAELANNQAQLHAETQIALTQAFADLQIATLESHVDLAQIGANRDVQIERERGMTDRRNSSNNMIGGIVNGVLGLGGLIFSEAGKKKNIEFRGYRESGAAYYSYQYAGGSQTHYGVLAEEAARISPGSVHSVGNALAVDYRRV